MPIDNDLKSTINYYQALGMPENEIISKMLASPRYSDLAQTVDYYLKQKLSPAQVLQKMADAPAPTAAPEAAPVAEAAASADPNDVPSFIQPHHGETQIGTQQVPDWKQLAMKGVNALPEIGEAVGTAGSMAATALSPAAALSIPAVAGMGRVTGRLAQTPLTQLLLPEADAQLPTPSEIASEGVRGATGGMMNASVGGIIPKVLNPAGSESIIHPDTALSGKLRDQATKKLISPSLKNPSEAREAVRTIGKGEFDIAGGKAPEQIQRGIANLSGEVDSIIADAAAKGEMVNTSNLIEPMYAIRDQYAQAGLEAEAAAASKQIAAFEALPRMIDPEKAQVIKKTIYSNISDNKWGQFNAPAATKVQKSFSTGIANNLEEISTKDLKAVNAKLGELIRARPYATAGAEKAQEAGVTKSLKNRGEQVAAKLMNRINRELEGRPDYVPDRENIGSPYQQLENMFGTKYNKPTPEPKPDLWEHSAKEYDPELHRVKTAGRYDRSVHPDWFEGLEPSPKAVEMSNSPRIFGITEAKAPPIAEDFSQFTQQMEPNIPVPEQTPGTLLEGLIGQGRFQQPEGWGQMPVAPKQIIRELPPNLPVQVQPEAEAMADTLMGAEVPNTGFKSAIKKKGK